MSDFPGGANPSALSSEGRNRREAILRLARREAWRRRRGASMRRLSAAAAILAAMFAVFLRIREPRLMPAELTENIIRNPVAPRIQREVSPPRIVVTRIRTDPTITARLSVGSSRITCRRIGDAELLEALAMAGKPGGLSHLDGVTKILFRPTLDRLR